MKKTLLFFIKVYQKTFSPDHGHLLRWKYPNGYCKYYPSCSEYAKQSIEKYGAGKGVFKAIIRILKCNPFSNGGIDLA